MSLCAISLRAVAQMATPLTLALAVRWIRDGSAETIITAILDEAAAQQKLAATVLEGLPYAARPTGHHLWLSLPRGWSQSELTAHVQRQGLALVSSDAFAVGDGAPRAIRVALGAASSRHELASALAVLAAALKSPMARIV